MKKSIFSVLLSLILSVTVFSGFASVSVGIIPKPNRISTLAGTVDLSTFRFSIPPTVDDFAVNLLREALLEMDCKESRKGAKIIFRQDKDLSQEAYCLVIEPKTVVVRAHDASGFLYGVQSLIQYLRASGTTTVASVQIEDAPRYPWRGYMLDESRHFFGKGKVKQLLDLMSYYKLNKFHWHLTDESGWRIEIKQYPLLTSVGGKGTWSNPNDPVAFYTQDDIREIVQYASDRGIEIIPEIDMPGHATAANNAYPFLSGGGTPEHPDFTFNPGKEEVYLFLSNVLKEVADLFPSQYMHIGGDEVSFGIKAWESDPHVQALLKRKGLSKVKDAERYFIHRMTDTINRIGKQLIGWDELLEIDADPNNTTIMWWRHDRVSQLEKSLTKKYPTILCPRRPLYFDFIQRGSDKWGRVWNGFCPIEDVYLFPDAGFSKWDLPSQECIIGIQANLWSERVHNTDRLDYMTFPRLCALAESAWTQKEHKNLDCFLQRMEANYPLFDRMRLYYYRPDRKEPQGPTRVSKEQPMDFRD